MKELYSLLGIAVIIAALCAIKYAIDILKAKKGEIKDNRVLAAIDFLERFINTVVNDINQKVVDELKSNPEKLFDQAKKDEIFNSAVDTVKLWLGDEQKDIIARYLGGARNLEDFIESEVSAKVRENKKPKEGSPLNVTESFKEEV
ncbi:hypothetical protein NH288_04825 [Anaerococcus sp. NML200537]|uniref:hypothetical protein n=1 Tax=Anaerococcus sp. NML200537 TaxID=2954485 RepID=UPI002237EDDC|nr:hypothetical protein [Anaerococcus sp. NML200537]MCW6701407.1 hypothetical protein [Anaerococcus sp. NML200537]